MKLFKFTLMAGLCALLPTGALAAPGGGISGTDHDFTQGGFVSATAVGACTFCHTPHKAITTQLLWNHTLSTNTFSWDIPKTTAGTNFASFKGDTYTGPTARCLSCHDGSVAVGDIAWFNDASYPGGVGTQPNKITGGHQIAKATGGMAGNHPVAMPYPYLNVGNTYNSVATGAAATLTEWVPDPSANGIKMYNDASGSVTGGPTALKTGIECSSCHEPHNGAAAKEDMFLRGMMTGSGQASGYLCQQCHVK